MNRILVTGSAGVIGTTLVPALIAAGFDVHCLDRSVAPDQDLVDGHKLQAALDGCTGVIHLAACARVGLAEADPARAWRDNVQATAALLHALKERHNAPWLIFTSSREVYGQPNVLPVTEAAPLIPSNVYGATKAEAENLVQQAVVGGLRAIILRLANVYGASHDQADRLVPSFVTAALNRHPLELRGGHRSLDLLHINDVITALLAAIHCLERGKPCLSPLNICSGIEVTLAELAARIVALAQSSSPILEKSPASHEVVRFVGSNAAAHTALGWSPKVSLDAGLQSFLTSYLPLYPHNGNGASMKVLQVIHGYPMRYNAGSEVYTQTLAQGLAHHHEVQHY
jgi:nucleoside-diphosphate-sugar epimerase